MHTSGGITSKVKVNDSILKKVVFKAEITENYEKAV
jgi:hypothetical protein